MERDGNTAAPGHEISLGGPRASTPSASMPSASTPSASEPSSALSVDDGSRLVVLVGDADGFERRLTPRQRLRRGTLVGALLAAMLFVLLGGPASALGFIQATWQQWHQFSATLPARFAAPAPLVRKAPPGANSANSLRVAPVEGVAGVAFACWLDPIVTTAAGTDGTVHLLLTQDSGGHWSTVQPPLARGSFCQVVADSVRPHALLALISPAALPVSPCALPTLSYSADLGATWRPVAWPPDAVPSCDVQVALVDGDIYAWSATALFARGDGGFIITSADFGATWRAVDGPLERLTNLSSLQVLAIRAGGALLVQGNATATGTSRRPAGVTSSALPTSVLAQTTDGGATWRELGALPGISAHAYATDGPEVSTVSPFGRLYLLAQTPGSPQTPMLATSDTGAQWTSFPLPPLVDAGGGKPRTPALSELDVGPSGSLLVTREIDINAFSLFQSPRQIWRWDEVARRWLAAPFSFPADGAINGVGWSDGTAAFWLVVTRPGVPPTITLDVDLIPPLAR